MASITVSSLHDALIVVDLQNDFVLPEGALSVPGALETLPVINAICSKFSFRAVVASKDWHPLHHCSFRTPDGPNGLWPPHCIRATSGAALHPDFQQDVVSHVVHKGMRADTDCYSAFGDETGGTTGLAAMLLALGVRRVFVCGVAYDYCVYFTALDALKDFAVVVIEDATRGVCPETTQERRGHLLREGAMVVKSDVLFSPSPTR